MRRGRLVGGAGAAALALAVAACGGGGGGDRLTLDEYLAQADAICKEFDGKFGDLGEPESAADAGKLVRDGKVLAEEQLAKLRELRPPEDIEAKVDEAYNALDDQIALFDDFADAVEAEDSAKVEEITGKLDDLNETADGVAKEIGLETCGST